MWAYHLYRWDGAGKHLWETKIAYCFDPSMNLTYSPLYIEIPH